MSRESVLVLIGVLVAVSPFSGLPVTWLAWILPVMGVAVLLIGVSLKAQKLLTPLPQEHEGNS